MIAKRTTRDSILAFRLTPDEEKRVREAARRRHLALASWLRMVVLERVDADEARRA